MAGLVIERQHFGFLRHARFLGAKSQILGVRSQDDRSVAQNPRSFGIVCWCPEIFLTVQGRLPFSVAQLRRGTLVMFETMTAVMGLVGAAIFLAHAFEGICSRVLT
jgi:hypothetical protein